MTLPKLSAFSGEGSEGCGLHICMETKLVRIGRQKTMENGADIPISLWNCLSISSLVVKLEGLFNQLLL